MQTPMQTSEKTEEIPYSDDSDAWYTVDEAEEKREAKRAEFLKEMRKLFRRSESVQTEIHEELVHPKIEVITAPPPRILIIEVITSPPE